MEENGWIILANKKRGGYFFMMTPNSITWAKRAGQAGAVVLALGMLAFYVAWSQRRAQPAAQAVEARSLENEASGETPESAAFFPGSKSLSGVIPESAVTSGLRFGSGAMPASIYDGLQSTGEDGYTIDLELAPEVVEFEGFVNYGTPIQVSKEEELGEPTTIMLGSKNIAQPLFPMKKKQKEDAKAKEGEPAAAPSPAQPSPELPGK